MATSNIYLDHTLGVANTLKLRQDIKDGLLNKLCMTEVLNADLSIAAYGEETYFAGCKDVLAGVQSALDAFGLSESIFLYNFNYKNFVLAAGDNISKEDFTNVMKQFYNQFESSSSSQVEVSGVSRFVVVLQEDKLIERALHSHLVAKDLHENFILTPDVMQMITTAHEDAKTLDLINFAMEQNRIIPYYQGIRNNKTGKIEKYEALMRIADAEGNIYSPYVFLDTAKKYKIYIRLSQMMIERSLEEFLDRPEQLSINISAYDIANENFREWFFRKLDNHPDTSKIVVEFVETENYQNEMLFDFVSEVRKRGCHISADDFGSGYATYSAIISLSPAFIKIDGTIIKDVATSKDNLIILRAICFLAELIGAKTIAEFVENDAIQAVLEQYNVDYSQGYLFSKPQPLESIIANKQ